LEIAEMVKIQAETKNRVRDLMEYILLISFVFVGSSFVVADELQAVQVVGKPQETTRVWEFTSVSHRHDIFGQTTKRHIN
jgi:hypothetical protein